MDTSRLAGYLLVLLPLLTIVAVEGIAQVTVEWIAVSDPGPGRDVTIGACAWKDTVFVVGWEELVENATYRFAARVEARNARDGLLKAVRRLDLGGSSWLWSCAVERGLLFVVGGWSSEDKSETRPYVASLRVDDLSMVSSVLSEPNATGASIAVVGDYVYVLGTIYGEGRDIMWLVEKREADDLELVKRFVYDPSPGRVSTRSYPCCVGWHDRTGTLWVVGYNDAKVLWTVLVLDEELELIREIEVPMGYYVGAVCFSREGSAYIAGLRGLASLDPTGRLLKKLGTAAFNVGIACGDDAIYVVSLVRGQREKFLDFVLHVYDEDLDVLEVIPLNVSTSRYYTYMGVKLLGDLLIVPLYETVRLDGVRPGHHDDRWVVMALRVSRPEVPQEAERETPKAQTPVVPPPSGGPAWLVYAVGAGVVALLVAVVLILLRPRQRMVS